MKSGGEGGSGERFRKPCHAREGEETRSIILEEKHL